MRHKNSPMLMLGSIFERQEKQQAEIRDSKNHLEKENSESRDAEESQALTGIMLDSSIAASAYAGHLHSKSAIPPTLPLHPRFFPSQSFFLRSCHM
ncbi:hypothetical protein K470DRAFT_260009 [Piedraia hortae CBS 480.64]|uniref:Uncharacterized protein n=1 Tax=Piedraia hortae CBS 480.64 TaxID=1314780 RepID=A0A6A7BU61_9PEZI|nr:hypothetical protein K470DRAFT_260009 [Piedraia hortae CBS 480.64]